MIKKEVAYKEPRSTHLTKEDTMLSRKKLIKNNQTDRRLSD